MRSFLPSSSSLKRGRLDLELNATIPDAVNKSTELNFRIKELEEENSCLKIENTRLLEENANLSVQQYAPKAEGLNESIVEIKSMLSDLVTQSKDHAKEYVQVEDMVIGKNGTKIPGRILNLLPHSAKDYSKAVRALLHATFGYKYLCTHSLTRSREKTSCFPKRPLIEARVNNIEYIKTTAPFAGNVSRSQIRSAIPSKCNDCSNYYNRVNGDKEKIKQHLNQVGIPEYVSLNYDSGDEDS